MTDVVLLAVPGETTHFVYQALQRELPELPVIFERPIARRELLKRRAKRLGVRKVAGQVVFQSLIVPALRRSSARRVAELKARFQLDDRPPPESAITHVASANDPETIALLQRLRPKVVVVNGTRILSREVLRSVEATFLNTHAGITPLYRGVHGGYWALADGRPEACGVTVHLINEGIDTGGIVGQAVIAPEPEDNFVTYAIWQYAAALPLLVRAVKDALAGRLAVKPPPPGSSRLWSHPTALEYLGARLRRGIK